MTLPKVRDISSLELGCMLIRLTVGVCEIASPPRGLYVVLPPGGKFMTLDIVKLWKLCAFWIK